MTKPDSSLIDVAQDGNIAVLTIERSAKANSLPQHAKRELAATIASLAEDDHVGAIVLTGAGQRAFCAGSDVDEMRHFGMEQMDAMLRDERAMYTSIMTAPKPVVAAVNGFALGAGLILAMSCDYIVAEPTASFGAPELTIGVAAPLEGVLLPHFVGLQRARAMFYTGARISASDAEIHGLVNEVVTGALGRTLEVAQQMAELPGDGFRIQKQLLHSLVVDGSAESVIRESHHLTSRQFTSRETGQAMTDFLSRR